MDRWSDGRLLECSTSSVLPLNYCWGSPVLRSDYRFPSDPEKAWSVRMSIARCPLFVILDLRSPLPVVCSKLRIS